MFRTAVSRTAVSRTAAPHRRAFGAAVLLAAVALTGCAAGQVSQTAGQVSAVSGGTGRIGQIDLLNVEFEPPTGTAYAPGSDVPLSVWVSNDSIRPDTLTAVSSPVAASGKITGTAVAQEQTLEDFGSKFHITLKGLKQPLSYGVSVPVTFMFQNAGSVTINVPVRSPGERTGGRPSIPLRESEQDSIWQSGVAAEGSG